MDEAQTDDAVFDGFNVLEIYNASSYGAWMAGLNLDEQYLENINGTIYKVLKDALGSTVGLTNSSQGLTDTYSYDPYGTPTHTYGASLNGALFAGQSWDFNNLYYMRARYYMPSIARFLSRDPAGGGVNPYLYAGDDPVDFSDPTGEWWFFSGDPCAACDPSPIWGGAQPGPGAYVPQPMPPANRGGLSSDVVPFYDGQNGGGQADPVIRVQMIEPYMEPFIEENPFADPLVEPEGAPGENVAPDTPDEPTQPNDQQEPNEHTKGKRQSTKEKHQKGQRRKRTDRPGGERGDKYRPYRQRGLWWWLNGGQDAGMI